MPPVTIIHRKKQQPNRLPDPFIAHALSVYKEMLNRSIQETTAQLRILQTARQSQARKSPTTPNGSGFSKRKFQARQAAGSQNGSGFSNHENTPRPSNEA